MIFSLFLAFNDWIFGRKTKAQSQLERDRDKVTEREEENPMEKSAIKHSLNWNIGAWAQARKKRRNKKNYLFKKVKKEKPYVDEIKWHAGYSIASMVVVINGYCHFARNITHSKSCVMLFFYYYFVCVSAFFCFVFIFVHHVVLTLYLSFSLILLGICHHDQLSRCYFLYTFAYHVQ